MKRCKYFNNPKLAGFSNPNLMKVTVYITVDQWSYNMPFSTHSMRSQICWKTSLTDARAFVYRAIFQHIRERMEAIVVVLGIYCQCWHISFSYLFSKAGARRVSMLFLVIWREKISLCEICSISAIGFFVSNTLSVIVLDVQSSKRAVQEYWRA